MYMFEYYCILWVIIVYYELLLYIMSIIVYYELLLYIMSYYCILWVIIVCYELLLYIMSYEECIGSDKRSCPPHGGTVSPLYCHR